MNSWRRQDLVLDPIVGRGLNYEQLNEARFSPGPNCGSRTKLWTAEGGKILFAAYNFVIGDLPTMSAFNIVIDLVKFVSLRLEVMMEIGSRHIFVDNCIMQGCSCIQNSPRCCEY